VLGFQRSSPCSSISMAACIARCFSSKTFPETDPELGVPVSLL
jgi:hypothetical protein